VAETPLRVVFDAHAITPRRSGIGEYSAKLLAAMCEAPDSGIELSLYANGRITPLRSADEIPTITAGIPDGSLYALKHQWELPLLLRRERCDLFHMPDFLAPPLLPVPFVCTIYDLIPLAKPEYIARSLKVRLLPLYRAIVRRSARRAARVLTISEHSRRDIVRMLGIDAARIDVTPLAPTVDVNSAPWPQSLGGRLQRGRYLLYVGRHDPYKGLGLLLDAFAAASGDPALDDVTLAIAGALDARYGYKDKVVSLGLDDRVVFLDYVGEEQLSPLYANALAFVFPSLYEGFGLPPLDAMRHGVPVLCSERTSLPEVTGDAALLFDPEDSKAFASALREICGNSSLRDELKQSGFQRQEGFSWTITAALTIEAYKRAAKVQAQQ
jgi:glycosyltransferase involved in cell wall biosynthesis